MLAIMNSVLKINMKTQLILRSQRKLKKMINKLFEAQFEQSVFKVGERERLAYEN